MERAAKVDPGFVAEVLRPAHHRLGFLRRLGHRRAIGDVEPDGVDVAALLALLEKLFGFVEMILADIGQHELGAIGEQLLRDAEADAARASRDEGRRASDLHEISPR